MTRVDGDIRSITTRQVFGSIGLSLPDDDVTMALTLSHEVQHAKLAALMDLLPMVTEPAPDLYYAPWRSDPRPLASLLQGMYAHLGVARFWKRHREVTLEPDDVHHAHVEFARWRNACSQVAKVVSGRPELTRCGSAFVDGMVRVLREWRDEYVPPEAQAQADDAISEHRRQWDMHRRGSSGTSPRARDGGI
jgi:HEXXH motif-containing protein